MSTHPRSCGVTESRITGRVTGNPFEEPEVPSPSPNVPDERAYLGRVLRVLDVVAASEQAVSMSEICRQMSLPMTTVHRLLVTLWKAGVLERDVRRRYVMGTRLTVLSSGSGSSGDAA